MRNVVVVAAGALILGMGSGLAAQDLQVGDMAPDFSLPASDGQTYTLSDLRGEYVVLAWFPKAFTGG